MNTPLLLKGTPSQEAVAQRGTGEQGRTLRGAESPEGKGISEGGECTGGKRF